MNLKIAKIDVFQLDLPYSGGLYKLSGGRQYTSFDATIVRVTADDGTEGWGESTPFGANYINAHARGVRAGIEEMAPNLLGFDPRRVDRLNDYMDELLAGHHHAKAPVDVACWDLFGKSVNLPVCELLGGSTGIRMPTMSSIGSDEPQVMRQNVALHRDMGYAGHSIKIGALDSEGGPALDAERISACLADRRPTEFFLVDANGGMTPESALRMLKLLPNGIDIVLEAPCRTWRENLCLRQRCQYPIIMDELACDEASIIQLISDDLADGIGLKISKNGGLTKGRRQRDICLAAGLTLSIQDTWGSEISFAAVAHLGQTVPEHSLRCILDNRNASSVVTAQIDAAVINGGVILGKQPGLGITPNLKVLGDPVASWGSGK